MAQDEMTERGTLHTAKPIHHQRCGENKESVEIKRNLNISLKNI